MGSLYSFASSFVFGTRGHPRQCFSPPEREIVRQLLQPLVDQYPVEFRMSACCEAVRKTVEGEAIVLRVGRQKIYEKYKELKKKEQLRQKKQLPFLN